VPDSPPVKSPPLALVADDLDEARELLARILHKEGFEVVEADDGDEAVRIALERRPQVVLLDLVMPRMDGLDALRRIRAGAPEVPVVVVSGVGEEAAERALNLGAVNYLSKPFVAKEVRGVLDRVRAAQAEESEVLPCVRALEPTRTVLQLGNDPAMLSRVVAFLGHELRIHYPDRELPHVETKLALYEALANAIEHGNLEIGYDAKTEAMRSEGGITGAIERRRTQKPWCDRSVRVVAHYEPTRVTYVVTDEGKGFEHRDPEALARLGDVHSLHGRGLLLIRHYMTRVAWNDAGNEIRMELDVPAAAGSNGDSRT
jgi:CheY-like chemotaxis protein